MTGGTFTPPGLFKETMIAFKKNVLTEEKGNEKELA
jgi:hypothetical protein